MTNTTKTARLLLMVRDFESTVEPLSSAGSVIDIMEPFRLENSAIQQWAVLGDMSSAVLSGFELGGRIEHVNDDTYNLYVADSVVSWSWSVLAAAVGIPEGKLAQMIQERLQTVLPPSQEPSSPIITGESPQPEEAITITETSVNTPPSTAEQGAFLFVNSSQVAFDVPRCLDTNSKAQASRLVYKQDGSLAPRRDNHGKGNPSANKQARRSRSRQSLRAASQTATSAATAQASRSIPLFEGG